MREKVLSHRIFFWNSLVIHAFSRMGTDKTHVGFVSENRHDFVGFCRFFPTDTNRHKYFHKPTRCRFFVGFLSVFCRFRARIFNKTRQNFDIFRTSLWFLETENYKIFIKKRLSLIGSISYHYLLNFNDLNTPKTPLRPYLVSL